MKGRASPRRRNRRRLPWSYRLFGFFSVLSSFIYLHRVGIYKSTVFWEWYDIYMGGGINQQQMGSRLCIAIPVIGGVVENADNY